MQVWDINLTFFPSFESRGVLIEEKQIFILWSVSSSIVFIIVFRLYKAQDDIFVL